MILNKKGFTLFETLLCLGILAVLLTITMPLLQGFIVSARINEANITASLIKNVINEYLAEQDIKGYAMNYNNKYSCIIIGVGNEPEIDNKSNILSDYTLITARNDAMPDPDLDIKNNLSTWGSYQLLEYHKVNITKMLNDALGGMSTCYIIVVVKNNLVEQVLYVPNADSLKVLIDYDKALMFFSEHCVIKGKTDNIDEEPFSDTATIFTIKENAVKEGRSTVGIYDGMIVGTSPEIK